MTKRPVKLTLDPELLGRVEAARNGLSRNEWIARALTSVLDAPADGHAHTHRPGRLVRVEDPTGAVRRVYACADCGEEMP